MSDPDGYTRRYSIRLPDGTIARSALGQPWMWDDADDAERALGYFRVNAERMGVPDWEGSVVQQLCTPWIGLHDNASQLVAELSAWLEQQIAGGS